MRFLRDCTIPQNPPKFCFCKNDNLTKIHQPAKAFVIDIARVDGEFKIIEINNLNSAGFYASDVQKIIAAIEELTPYYQENIDK